MQQIEMAALLAATMFGSIFGGWLGWLESGDDFDDRKFLSTMLRGLFISIVEYVTFITMIPDTQVTIITIAIAFLMGAGFDVIVKRGQGAVTTQRNNGTVNA